MTFKYVGSVKSWYTAMNSALSVRRKDAPHKTMPTCWSTLGDRCSAGLEQTQSAISNQGHFPTIDITIPAVNYYVLSTRFLWVRYGISTLPNSWIRSLRKGDQKWKWLNFVRFLLLQLWEMDGTAPHYSAVLTFLEPPPPRQPRKRGPLNVWK